MFEGPTLPLLRMELVPVLRRLPSYSRLAWALVRERRIRRRHRLLLLGGIGYLLSPVDLIPGFVPVLGQLDDLGIALWALRRALRAAPPEVAQVHLRAAGLSSETLDADLARVNRSGRLLTRAAFRTGRSLAVGAGRTLWRLGRQVLAR
ncbi:MAG: YkvA family protein [Armatimonadota bacterium]|nr:YkvA family protein [Armatimonadota bacterium]MDR7427455.1 YkvA family protein [Armatimonadota bacterium]MDR7465041.1 YkvA family protein [Armatimonadota bacterium]MDR7469985.1 YkvA family protein [Armatimonadota bacterium]MDR7540364.1 YkvA family protein [Armatimonadota bacterium]